MDRATVSSFYDLAPSLDHRTGDIWSGLPMHDLLGRGVHRGLVLTPACDLTNRKVESIAYVPVLSIREYFSTFCVLPHLARELQRQLTRLGRENLLELPSGFGPPPAEGVQRAIETLSSVTPATDFLPNHTRATALLKILALISDSDVVPTSTDLLVAAFGETSWTELVQKIIRNSWRTDLHFLPADGQPPDWSGVPDHSVALFRFPLSVPIEFLDLSQDVELKDWPAVCERLAKGVPFAALTLRRPVKHQSVRPRFVADIVARFVGLYVRLGSPDFTKDSIDRFAADCGGRP